MVRRLYHLQFAVSYWLIIPQYFSLSIYLSIPTTWLKFDNSEPAGVWTRWGLNPPGFAPGSSGPKVAMLQLRYAPLTYLALFLQLAVPMFHALKTVQEKEIMIYIFTYVCCRYHWELHPFLLSLDLFLTPSHFFPLQFANLILGIKCLCLPVFCSFFLACFLSFFINNFL